MLPPHTMQAPTRCTIPIISSKGMFTGARTSILSAVPAGLVMARLLLFGMV